MNCEEESRWSVFLATLGNNYYSLIIINSFSNLCNNTDRNETAWVLRWLGCAPQLQSKRGLSTSPTRSNQGGNKLAFKMHMQTVDLQNTPTEEEEENDAWLGDVHVMRQGHFCRASSLPQFNGLCAGQSWG